MEHFNFLVILTKKKKYFERIKGSNLGVCLVALHIFELIRWYVFVFINKSFNLLLDLVSSATRSLLSVG